MIESYLQYAREKNSSDVHLTEGLPAMMRLNGSLIPMTQLPITNEELEETIVEMTSAQQREKLKLGEDLDFAYVSHEGSRHRVNVYKQRGSFAIAIRLLQSRIPTLEELELPEVLDRLTDLPRGLILVTGPTGSGKSTTLAAMIDRINEKRNCHILTLEDPIEYLHKHKKSMVNQREIGSDAYSFAHALRSALREDPDVILVGEMRDYESISLALTAAETGHLVLSTLHTTNVAQTIDRIIDVFPANQQAQVRTQLSTSLRAIIAQHLLKRADRSGRIAALEVLLMTEAVGNLIRENKAYQIPTIMQTHMRDGMQTLDMNLAQLVREGKIEMDLAIEVSTDPQTLRRLTGFNNI